MHSRQCLLLPTPPARQARANARKGTSAMLTLCPIRKNTISKELCMKNMKIEI